MKNFFVFVVAALITLIPPFSASGQNIKAEIAKDAKKTLKDAQALNGMKNLAVISVWGVDWHARGMAGPGDISYADNRRKREQWMKEIFKDFEPRLEASLKEMFNAHGKEIKPISFTTGNAGYQAFEPAKKEPKKGIGFLQGTIEGLKFIDDEQADVAGAARTLGVDGVVTIRYKLEPAAIPTKKNQLKLWMKIFNNDGELVWFGKMYSEFKAGAPKFGKLENYSEFLPDAEKEALNNLKMLFDKAYSKIK